MSPVDERLYADLMEPRRQIWLGRAKRARGETVAVYAQRRAEALARPYMRKLRQCRTRGCRVKCGCKGWRGFRPYTCRQAFVCEACRHDRSKRMGARMCAGLEAALAPRPGMRRKERIVLLTLTIRHSGDVARDRAELAAGWQRLRKALWRRWGAWNYVGVWEVTPGNDGLGHVHAHVACVWPWRDWGEVSALWRQCCPDSTRISFVAGRRDGRESTPKSVANYLGKYLAKGAQAADFTPQLLSRVLAGTYNTRWVFSSRGFWQLFVPCCANCQQPIISAQFHWHGASIHAGYDWIAEWQRGPPQLALALPEPDERAGCRRA